MRTRRAIVLALLSLSASSSSHAFDTALYARLLERHTVAVGDIASTRVDYAALRGSPDWGTLLTSLRVADPQQLASRPERLAFWINAYNVLAIDLVQRHYPVGSIRDVGSLFSPVWKKPAGEIGGGSYTLDQIEHEILRPLGEPRVHGAIVCASLSCPPLRRAVPRRGPRRAARRQRAALARGPEAGGGSTAPPRMRSEPDPRWFAEDFGGDALAFVAQHLPPADGAWIQDQRASLRIRWFDYDWSLNDTASAASAS
jgi:hypothetical protein